MINAFIPEDILPDGEDHTLVVNPFTGLKGKARKGTVAATLNNIALLDRLFLENNEDQVVEVQKAIETLMPSLKAVGIFDLFNLCEWVNPKKLGRTYVALLYLKQYPEEMTDEMVHKLQEIKQKARHPLFQSVLLSL